MTDTYTPVLTDAQIGAIVCDVYKKTGAAEIGELRLRQDAIALGRAVERAAIEAYQRQQWRPIEIAPQGTMLLMADMRATEARNWAFVDWLVDGKCCGNRYRTPTHWQPLPPSPETQS